jgi:hypothetical protein
LVLSDSSESAQAAATPELKETPLPSTSTSEPTTVPITGFVDPVGDAVSALTGQPVPANYPSIDIQQIDWSVEGASVKITLGFHIPVVARPDVFQWGLQVGVFSNDRLMVTNYAVLSDGAVNAQYDVSKEGFAEIKLPANVTPSFNDDNSGTAQFTFDTGAALGEFTGLIVRGFSEVDGQVGVIDTGIWPEHPSNANADDNPWIPLPVDTNPSIFEDKLDKLGDRLNENGYTLTLLDSLPGWEADPVISFPDAAGDVLNANTFASLGEPDPAVDILRVDVTSDLSSTLDVNITLGSSPTLTIQNDYSFYCETAVRDENGVEYAAAFEIHDGASRQGLFDLTTFQIQPDTAYLIQVQTDSLLMSIPAPIVKGDLFVGCFHMATSDAIRTYDESANNSFHFVTGFVVEDAFDIIGIMREGGSSEENQQPTVTPVPTVTPTALPEPTATLSPPTPTPTELPPTPTVVADIPDNGLLPDTLTSTFTISNTGELSPVDVAYLFLDEYDNAHDTNNYVWLLETLHPDSFSRYGFQQCEDYLQRVTGCCENFNSVSYEYPVEFIFDKDGITTVYTDVVRLQVEFTVKGEVTPRENSMHILLGQQEAYWYANWFTDCGDPIQ